MRRYAPWRRPEAKGSLICKPSSLRLVKSHNVRPRDLLHPNPPPAMGPKVRLHLRARKLQYRNFPWMWLTPDQHPAPGKVPEYCQILEHTARSKLELSWVWPQTNQTKMCSLLGRSVLQCGELNRGPWWVTVQPLQSKLRLRPRTLVGWRVCGLGRSQGPKRLSCLHRSDCYALD